MSNSPQNEELVAPLLKDDCAMKTNEIVSLCSKQAPRHIRSVLSCSKKYFISCLLHATVCLPTVEKIHTPI